MKTLLSIRGRLIADTDIEQVRSLIEKYGNRSRAYISIKFTETWKWYQANGRLKDRACWDILSALESKGLIRLPPLSPEGNRSKIGRIPFEPAVKVDTSPKSAEEAIRFANQSKKRQ